jgi:hypothetical protein
VGGLYERVGAERVTREGVLLDEDEDRRGVENERELPLDDERGLLNDLDWDVGREYEGREYEREGDEYERDELLGRE